MSARFLLSLLLLVTSVNTSEQKPLRFASGFKGGTYHKIATSLQQVEPVKPLVTDGSIANINLVARGKADIGLAQLDILNNSVTLKKKTRQKIKVVLPIYREEIHLLTKKPVRSYKSLAGKMISIGPENSGTAETANIILIAMKLKNRVKIDYSSSEEGLQKLKDGKIDALFIVAGMPVKLLADQKEELHLVTFRGVMLKFLTSVFFPYKKTRIKPATYPWLTSRVTTLSVASVLIARHDLPDERVTSLVKKIFNNKKVLTKSHEKWGEVNRRYARYILKAIKDFAHPAALPALK